MAPGVTYRWDVAWAQTREQRIAEYHLNGEVHYRADGELDMRYASSRFIADPEAGILRFPALSRGEL